MIHWQPRSPHFAPKAKTCIFILPEGAPSHIDLFDPKPKLNELHGEKLPESMTKNVRFAFIKKESAVLWASTASSRSTASAGWSCRTFCRTSATAPTTFALIRSMHTDAFNHHPAQLMIMSGVPRFGRPSMGSWLTYGLGSESENLPGYVVLTAGRGGSGGVSNWTSGFLPSTYQGVLFRNKGDPVLNLANPPGVGTSCSSKGSDAIASLNRQRLEHCATRKSRAASRPMNWRSACSQPRRS